MEEINKPKASAIDYIKVWNAIKQRRKLFYKTLSVAFVIGCIYSLSIPRFYITEVKVIYKDKLPRSWFVREKPCKKFKILFLLFYLHFLPLPWKLSYISWPVIAELVKTLINSYLINC